ncbi:hypothetical protein F5X96DRAFT_665192 [Biscogniauxia mediterranea]|nr:hypothetical protein F5X96DRAFT_665192 [Biscogniauxia mediterranea]
MGKLSVIPDFPSPTNSMPYIYSDNELYPDSSSTSSTTSPMELPYDLSALGIYDRLEIPDESRDANQSEFHQPATKPAAKRKRENRYKNAPPSVLSRRRAQNRASQRAYRERKDQRIKDLEDLLSQTQQKNDVLSQAYETLQAEYVKLKGDKCTQNDYQHANLAYGPAAVGLLASDLDFLLFNDQSLPFQL